ncbi:hypothetical protein BGY98DRAFT_943225 [Russula aff. rugulosa BPL654]|nr:hypothetical protein BGY98DRAFT_943225 [Russula aff. rugulosa BPL654]
MTDSEPIHKSFDDDLPGLLNEVDQVLRNADGPQLDNKIDHILARLETYNGLDNFQRLAQQDLQDALKFRALLSPKEYLTDVTPGTLLGHGNGCRVACVYEGRWKGERVAVKKFRSNKPADKPFLSFSREFNLWKEVSTCDGVWPLLGYTMPSHINLGWDSPYLKPQIFAGYVCTLSYSMCYS